MRTDGHLYIGISDFYLNDIARFIAEFSQGFRADRKIDIAVFVDLRNFSRGVRDAVGIALSQNGKSAAAHQRDGSQNQRDPSFHAFFSLVSPLYAEPD